MLNPEPRTLNPWVDGLTIGQVLAQTAKKHADRTWNLQDRDYVFKYERR